MRGAAFCLIFVQGLANIVGDTWPNVGYWDSVLLSVYGIAINTFPKKVEWLFTEDWSQKSSECKTCPGGEQEINIFTSSIKG